MEWPEKSPEQIQMMWLSETTYIKKQLNYKAKSYVQKHENGLSTWSTCTPGFIILLENTDQTLYKHPNCVLLRYTLRTYP